MPSRTYTGLDLTGYTEVDGLLEFEAGSGIASVIAVPVQQARFSIVGSGSISDNPPTGGGSQISGSYQAFGDFDYTIFPTIPNDALITKLRVKIQASILASASCTGTDLVRARVDATLLVRSLPAFTTLTNLGLSLADFEDTAGTASASIAGSKTFSTEEEIIFAPAIDKATFIATWAGIEIFVTGIIGEVANLTNPAPDGVGTYDWFAEVDNFQWIVEYSSGPNIILTPTGGDVEPGQIIQVSSPDGSIDVTKLEYAALQGDNVIPIPISPDGRLEIPSPANTPCSDCFGNCPECETCFTACENDLTSEACQECLDTCLDCLVDCLEDLESAEACIGTTGEPPSPIPIIIIVADPGTQFAGSVPLGTFTILVANATGIYRLTPGKANDTLYHSARDGTTYDVKIPNPFGKTGFFRS